MKGRAIVTAVAVLASAVAVAQNVDSKPCLYAGHMMVQLGDVVVNQGGIARPMYSFQVSAWPDGEHPYSDIPVDLENTWCIDGDCHTLQWNGYQITPTRGVDIGYTGTLDGKPMLTKGTFNSTYRLHSRTLRCDVTAVGTVFVQ